MIFTNPFLVKQTLVVIGTDCTGRCKYIYHAMSTATVPMFSIETNLFYTVNSFVFSFFFVFFLGGGNFVDFGNNFNLQN